MADVSRSASSNRTNDRLQERLARAIAAKNTAQKTDSSTPSRTGSPAQNSESPRQSVDVALNVDDKAGAAENTEKGFESGLELRITPSIEVERSTTELEQTPEHAQESSALGTKAVTENSARLSVESARQSVSRDSIDSTIPDVSSSRPSIDDVSGQTQNIIASHRSPEEYEALLKLLQSDFEASELQKQDEIHDYVERIDTLQAKLQYLAKESAESAKKASNAAEGGSLEKKLADKDEQVALLMEEGQKLSKKELTHLSTIKKLRAKIQEDGKEIVEIRRRQEKAEKDAASASDRLRRAEVSEKQVIEKQRTISQLQKEIDALKAERDLKDSTIARLKSQLEEAAAEEQKAEAKAAHESLVAERKRVADLEDDVANLKIEKNLVADRAQSQIKELREKIDKDRESARMLELEMKSEQQMLESKLEVMRARAEEVTTGATGDAQAKLLRQIETLQTQYAVASENWQGIEASLVARATSLEKERDEATKREADIRKKAREVVSANVLYGIFTC